MYLLSVLSKMLSAVRLYFVMFNIFKKFNEIRKRRKGEMTKSANSGNIFFIL